MEGILLTYTDRQYWYTRYYQLIDAEGKTSFKKSYLWRPDDECLFGDKSVSHRKMEGSVRPYVESLPRPWSDRSDIVVTRDDSTTDRWSFSMYESGINTCQCIGSDFRVVRRTGAFKISNPQGYLIIFKIEMKGTEKHLFYYRYMFEYKKLGYSTPKDVKDHFVFPDPGQCTLYQREDVGYFDVSKQKWKFTKAPGTYFNTSKCTFTLSDPLPYYWIDFMDSIRPKVAPSLLSEVIRNTITEDTTLATNNIANLTEVIGLINDFRKGKIVDLIENSKDFYRLVKDTVGNLSGKNLRTLLLNTSKEVSSGWLKYRYAYSTTKADVEQYTSAVLGEKLGRLDSSRVLRGRISDDFTEVRIKMRLHDKTAPNFDYLLIGLNQYGLMPSLYNVWDMIPFSFVADWGSNLGDYLQDIDESVLYWRYYEIDELLVSYKTQCTISESWGLTSYVWYDRSFLHEFPQWEIYDQKETSARVKCYRFLDAVSLFVGSL